LVVALRPTHRAGALGCMPSGGPINSQADASRILKGFVAFGTVQGGDQGGARYGWVQPFGEVAQGVIPKRLRHAQRPATGMHQLFHGMETDLPSLLSKTGSCSLK
jgi:hypothetical protein